MKDKKKLKDNIIFIPVRSGSTRIKNKNLQKIKGVSLLKKKIIICKKSGIGKIVISSNCNKILKEASKISGIELFKRQQKYATSKASSISTILEYLRNLKKKKSWKSVQKSTLESENGREETLWSSRMASRKPPPPPSRMHFSNKKQLFEQVLQHFSGFVSKKS